MTCIQSAMTTLDAITRRHFFGATATGIGSLALGSLLADGRVGSESSTQGTHFAPHAKRIIYLFQAGGPASQDLFDYKPTLNTMHGQELPTNIRANQRLTAMSAQQASFPLAGSPFSFERHGESGAWLSELLPYHRKIVDECCFVKSMYTEAINHDPAITFMQTGSEIAGRPSMGAWLSYGLGSVNQNLPAFIVLISAHKADQPLYARLWGNGFLDSRYQGVPFRSGNDPILYLGNPPGIGPESRRKTLDAINTLNRHQLQQELDPEVEARIEQYEMAFRMQTSVPELMDLSDEPDHVFEMYGPDSQQPGTYARHCLIARRLVEQGVRFIQLYHQGWDHHAGLPSGLRVQCRDTDQASAALVMDLKQRGLLDDTLVVWGGEFGRTSYSQGPLTESSFGRDHHPRCFTVWLAGGGIQPGMTYGQTDEYGYNITDANGAVIQPSKEKWQQGAVHVHDLQATILHQFGIDHEQLTFQYQGRHFRLTDVHGHVVHEILTNGDFRANDNQPLES